MNEHIRNTDQFKAAIATLKKEYPKLPEAIADHIAKTYGNVVGFVNYLITQKNFTTREALEQLDKMGVDGDLLAGTKLIKTLDRISGNKCFGSNEIKEHVKKVEKEIIETFNISSLSSLSAAETPALSTQEIAPTLFEKIVPEKFKRIKLIVNPEPQLVDTNAVTRPALQQEQELYRPYAELPHIAEMLADYSDKLTGKTNYAEIVKLIQSNMAITAEQLESFITGKTGIYTGWQKQYSDMAIKTHFLVNAYRSKQGKKVVKIGMIFSGITFNGNYPVPVSASPKRVRRSRPKQRLTHD